MNTISFRQVRIVTVSFLIAGYGIAGENWDEKLIAL